MATQPWISDRLPMRRRKRSSEAPRLQLPMPRPPVEHAKPSHEPEHAEKAERGAAIVDFYI